MKKIKLTLDLVKVILMALGGVLAALNVAPVTVIDEIIAGVMMIIGAIWTVNAGQNHATIETQFKSLTATKTTKE